MAAVTLNSLTKTYGKEKTVAVDAVSLSVEKGELFGLIGPDGAGKTSVFRMLTTLLLPDGGSATVDGFDIVKDYKQIRNTIGYMPGKFSLYQDLSIEENLEFFATVFNTTIQENYQLIEAIYVQIEPFKTRKAGKLSGGMKQKLALCCALIHKPTVLFLDEPTTGVDAVSRKEFWDMLKGLKEQGITILVSTPYMDEANLCDRIALMQTGKVLSVDTPQNITRAYGENLYAVKADNMIKLLRDVQGMESIKSCFAFGEFHHVVFKEDTEDSHQKFLENLKAAGHKDLSFQKIEPTIEDCFIKLLSTTNH
jgi:ABC-2 type transport system ATP-binding protein